MTAAHDRTPRRSTRRQLLSMAAAGGTAAAVAGVTGAQAGTSPSAQTSPSIVGSWIATYNRSSGDVLTGLFTCHSDGTFVGTASDHLTRGPSHGHWASLGNGKYSYSVQSMTFDASGNYSGITALDGEFTLDSSGKSWSCVSEVNVYDVTGAWMASGNSLATGTRVPQRQLSDPAPKNIRPASGGS